MKNLENKTIILLDVVTNANSISKKSRLLNKEITLGEIVYTREDGCFFENILIDGQIWRPFLLFSNNTIDLDCISNSRNKTITIKKYNIKTT